MVDSNVELTQSQHVVGLDGSHRLSLAFKDAKHTFPKNTAVVIGIGDSNKTPPMLLMGDKMYCPTGFGKGGDQPTRARNFIQVDRSYKFGRESDFPLTKGGEIDPTISRKHLAINKQGEQITVINMGQNGTCVAEATIITTTKGGGKIDLRRGAAVLDPHKEVEVTLTIGEYNNTVELIIGPSGVKKRMGDRVMPLLPIDPQKKDPQSLILGRADINPNDQTVSRSHLSIIWDPQTKKYFLFDHSTNGTKVEVTGEKNQLPKQLVKKEGERKTEGRTPRVILATVGHPDQQIVDDPHSFGGDYYLFGREVVSRQREYLLEKGGDAVVLMDTASIQTAGETPLTTTRPFAQEFLIEYYKQIEQGKDPQKAMRAAYEITYKKYDLGRKTEATFTFVTVVGGVAYSLWVGNTEAVVVRKSGKIVKLADKKGMVFESYLDPKTGYKLSPTILVTSGKDKIREQSVVLQPGDKIYVFTDGVKQLDPKNPSASSLNGDDAVIVEL